ncbi:MAG: cupredoxin family copper-binding protein [Dehalococcoidia bacterium]|nr:cupredoxin family copper-binding protein [Dehalococcoidia bacterium]MCZ7579169.1 cupredoxin family copper-binding protein [Dehalococcoidia bacterium]
MQGAGQQRALVKLLGGAALGLLLAVPTMGVLLTAAWAGSGCGDGMPMMMNKEEMRGMMGGGRDSSNDDAVRGSAVETVVIEDFAFSPGNLHVPMGTSVTWINRDAALHSATDSDGSWDSGVLSDGERASLVFDTRGTVDYFCTLHPNMKARLVVE